jgi:GNAT superfamily N-acetyltransferase
MDDHIRLARPDEVLRLREIEDAAGAIFEGLGLIDEALDRSFPLDDLARLVDQGQVWVACPEDDLPVGMVIASVREGSVYIEEMDVLPAHGRRGLGARLLAQVCAWARAQGHPAVTLSTFRDLPWNGPFYRKHGFRDLQPAEWTPGMHAIREQEASHGLRVADRVFMRRELEDGPGQSPSRRSAGGQAPSRGMSRRPASAARHSGGVNGSPQ